MKLWVMSVGNLPASTSRKFNPADYKAAPDWFKGRFLSQLNLFTDPVYTALLNGLSFQQNFNAQFFTAVITGAAQNSLSFKKTMIGQPVGLVIAQKNIVGALTTPLISPIDFSWYVNAGVVVVTGISGLAPGTNYQITFMLF